MHYYHMRACFLSSRSRTRSEISPSYLVRRFSSSCKILCVDVPSSIAEHSCIPELIHRGHVVEQHYTSLHPNHSSVNNVTKGSYEARKLDNLITKYDALIISPDTKLSRTTLINGAQSDLRMIASPIDHYDSENVDIIEATNQNIMLLQLEKNQMSDPFSVEAELAFSLLLDLTQLCDTSGQVSRDDPNSFERYSSFAEQIKGKKLGIIGLGQAGLCVAEMAKAFEMDIYGYDPNFTKESAMELGINQRDTLEELYGLCDVISFHVPLTGKTRGMFNDNALYQCKDGMKIISVSEYCDKDGLFDQKALLKGLSSGKISGIGMDILQEPEATFDFGEGFEELMAHPNARIQFHEKHMRSAASSIAAQTRKYRTIAENLGNALARRKLKGVANGIFMPLTLLPEMQPFLDLGEYMGKLLYQYLSDADSEKDSLSRISRISISTTGGVVIDITTAKARSALQSAIMKGFLAARANMYPDRDQYKRLSLLNSSLLSLSEGIDVRLQDSNDAIDVQHLKNSITIQAQCTGSEPTTITGSVFGEEPRIVRIDEYTDIPSFRPDRNILLFKNEDQPGVVARILEELAKSSINIANFGLARQEKVKFALGVLALDSPPSEATLSTLRKLPSVHSLQLAQS